MSRYVDAEILKERLIKNITLTNAIDRSFNEAPSIDIVRCKECKYAHMTYGGECKYCDKWSLEDSLYLDGDFFCSYGEREGE